MVDFKVLFHSSIKFIYNGMNIYFDPFKINKESNDADIIFITHDHFDHYSIDDIKRIVKDDTIFVAPKSIEGVLVQNLDIHNCLFAEPNGTYEIKGFNFDAVPSYNKEKEFHPKSKHYLGYNLNLDGIKYYVMGDTDTNEDVLKVKADYIFIPVGGKFTFDALEAAKYINKIKPKAAIPMHYTYNEFGVKEAYKFKECIQRGIEVIIME